MKMHIKTVAEGCHITVHLKIGGHILASLLDNEEREINLLPGITYTFEWHVWTALSAHAQILAEVTPPDEEFPVLNIDKQYPAGVQDANVFLFTLNQ